MLNPELIKFIKEELALKISKENIVSKLIQKGWQQAQIDYAFKFLALEVTAPITSTQPQLNPILQSPPNYLPGVIQIFKEAWKIYQAHFKTLVVISIIPIIFLPIIFIAALVLPLMVSSLGVSVALIFLILITIIALFVILLNLWAPLALLYAIKDRNEKIGFKAAFGRSRGKIFLFTILSLIYFTLIILGYAFFIVPGIIFSVWFGLAIYVFVTENTGPIAALKKSKEYVNGKFFAVLYRSIGFGLLIGFILGILSIIPIVNFFAPLILTPLLTISYFVLYEHLRNLGGKPISNPPSKSSKLILSTILIVLTLLTVLFLGTFIFNVIRGYNQTPTTYKSFPNRNLNSNKLNSFPTNAPMLPKASASAQTPAPIPIGISTCTVDWSQFLVLMAGSQETVPITFTSNFGTSMPSIYMDPSNGQPPLYRDSNSSGSNLNSVTVHVSFTVPAAGTYTLKPYLDDSSGKGVECNEKTFTSVEQNPPPPTQ